MTVFITTILVLAFFLSCCKLSLVKWYWGLGAALAAGALPLFFAKRIANSSMLELNRVITDPGVLNNWCALIVIQELLCLVAGFSLLKERSEEKQKAPSRIARGLKKVKYAVFLPSLLFPAGVFYLQMYLFNRCPALTFNTLTWLTAGGIFGAVLLIVWGTKIIFSGEDQRILKVLHVEYILVLTAIFLPVAAHAKLMPSTEKFAFRDPLLLLLAFAGTTLIFTLIFYIKRKKGKCHVNCNPNS